MNNMIDGALGLCGVNFKESGGSDLAFTCKFQGPSCCKISSIVKTHKTSRISGIGVLMDVIFVNQLFIIE